MTTLYNKDIQVVIQAELENNAKVRAMARAYEELTETDKALFRLATGIVQDAATNSRGRQRNPDAEPAPGGEPGQVQPLVRSLMRTLLEDYPALLTEADIRNLMNREYCKNSLALELKNLALLRNVDAGRHISGRARYWTRVYANRIYVCNNWWKDDHLANAKSLLRFVTELAERNPNHPGVPALEHHQQALRDYIGQPELTRISLE